MVIGSYRIHLLLSWDALCSTVDTASYLEISFALRSVQLANRSNRRIGPDSAEKNAQSRETVKTLTPNFCQLNHVNSGVGKCTDFSHDPTKQEDMFKNAKNRTFPTRCFDRNSDKTSSSHSGYSGGVTGDLNHPNIPTSQFLFFLVSQLALIFPHDE